MKRTIFVYLIALGCCWSALAQEGSGSYLFNDFRDAIVNYKDGRRYGVPLNYDLVQGYFLFVDKSDGNKIKRVIDPEKIASVQVDERVFLASQTGATEILQHEPPIYLRFKGKVKEQRQSVGYGGQSAIGGGVQTYSGVSSDAIVGDAGDFTAGSAVMDGVKHEYEVVGVERIYQVQKGKKKKSFSNENQFLKIYPEQKDNLKQYIDTNKVRFDSVDDVVKLCNYAASL